MSTSYDAWARYDVDKELERVDAVEQQEQQRKQQQQKVAEKRSVEDSISRDAEQSAEALAAHAAVAALKAKKGKGRKWPAANPEGGTQAAGSGAAPGGEKGGSESVDAEMLSRLADMMKQKHALIKEIMQARRRADEFVESADWDASQKEYGRGLASAKALEGLTPELMELQTLQASILGKHPVQIPKGELLSHGNQERHVHTHNHGHDHSHGSACHCSNDTSDKTEKTKTAKPAPLPKSEDLDAVVKMFLKDCYLGIGACEMGKSHYAAASEMFKEVLLRDDSHLLAWLQRGKCFEKMDAPLLAWLHFNRVTSQDADFDDAKECEARIKSVLLQQTLVQRDDVDANALAETMSLKEILRHIKLHMDAGNVIMIEGFHEYAVLKYESALRLLTATRAMVHATPAVDELPLRRVVAQLEVSCHVNNASCFLEMQKHFARAVKHCQLALEIDPGHIIANFRMGQAHRALHDYESALQAFHTVRTLLSYLPTEKANEQRLKLEKEVDKCEFERSQYDSAYIRQQLQ